MPGIWVPWRPGSTAAEQAKRRTIRQAKARSKAPKRGSGPDKKSTAKALKYRRDALKKERRALFTKLKQGRITAEEYHAGTARIDREIRKLG